MNYKWKEDFINLGVGTTGKTYTAQFEYEGDPADIVSVKASCDCTDLSLDRKNGILSVSYKAEKIPHHLRNIGYFTPHKMVKVRYKSGHEVTLTFKIRINNE